MERRFGMRRLWGAIIIVLLWALHFFDSYQPEIWKKALLATITVGCLVTAFHVGQQYFPAINSFKKHRLKIALWAIFLTVISVLSELLLTSFPTVYYGEETPYSVAVVFAIIYFSISITISMIFSWAYFLTEKNRQNELAISRLTALNKESELNELKNQLNPHFLFNALSNIYSIAYLGDKETPDKIMQLSKMLRYVIYDTDVEFISLSKEIDYLNHFIDFQKFKIKEEQQIDFDFSNCDQDIKIAPLILLPFIENSFKHSLVGVEKEAWVKVELSTKDGNVYFKVENTISSQVQPEILNNNGIGLENIKKRLGLIYKSNHTLSISENEVFKVQLEVQSR